MLQFDTRFFNFSCKRIRKYQSVVVISCWYTYKVQWCIFLVLIYSVRVFIFKIEVFVRLF